jgi:protoheme ferro-lyase
MTEYRIEELGADRIREYASIPIAFEVESIFVVSEIDKYARKG